MRTITPQIPEGSPRVKPPSSSSPPLIRWSAVVAVVTSLTAATTWMVRTPNPAALRGRTILTRIPLPLGVPPATTNEPPQRRNRKPPAPVVPADSKTESHPGVPLATAGSVAGRARNNPSLRDAPPSSDVTAVLRGDVRALESGETTAQTRVQPAVALPSVPLMPMNPEASVARAVVTRAPEMDAVLHTLNRYADALTRMDVSSAEQIWPTVDHRALSGAFKTLEKNEMVLNACAIDLGSGNTAVVTCHATVEFVPKVGNRSAHVASQQWRFTMNKIADEWKIQAASASADR